MLICGTDLDPFQRNLVLAAFTYRWTHENARQTYRGHCPACVQHRQFGGAPVVSGLRWHEYHVPLTSDCEWLRRYAFHFTRDGKRLKAQPKWCERVFT